MAALQNGPAIFSTDLGRFALRDRTFMPGRIVLRSVPEDDRESKIAELRAKFPDQCRAITSPVASLYDYFDHYDQELHGAMFLRAVLEEICGRNLMRKQDIFEFTQEWLRKNQTNFPYLLSYGLDNAFTADDREHYGQDFLQDALGDLQLQKIKHDNTVAVAYHGHYLPADSSFPNPGSAQDTVPTQALHQADPTLYRNLSDSTTLSIDAHPPKMNPSALASSPMVNPGYPISAPFMPVLQHFGPTYHDQPRPQHLVAQQYSPQRTDIDRHGSNIDSSRGEHSGFFAVPPPGVVGGQHPPYQMSSRPTRYNQPANRVQPLLKSKGPSYLGPSNDARILERQGVPRGRGPLGERNMTRGNHYPSGAQIPQSRQLPSPREGQYFGPLHSSGAPLITPSSLSKELSANTTAHSSSAIPTHLNEGMQHPRWEPMQQPFGGKAYNFNEEHTSPNGPSGSRHQNSHNHEAPTPSGRTEVELRLPVMMHGSMSGNQMGSHTLRRFSNNTNASHGVNPATQHNGHHYFNGSPRGRPHSMEEEYPLSDQKVWIGGLPPSAEIRALDGLLERFGPFKLSEVLVSKYSNNKESGGFAFADFDHPEHAFNAVEALNGKDITSLSCKIFVKPARIKPLFSHQTNATPRGIQAYTGRDKYHDVENDYRRRLNDGVSQIPPNQNFQNPSKLKQQSAGLTQAEIHSHRTDAPLALPSSSLVPGSKDTLINTPHSHWSGESNVRAHKSSIAAIGSPSPSKKKKGRGNKDVSLSGKDSQAKLRKEMLSQLRTEKSGGVASTEIMTMPVLPAAQNHDAPRPPISMILEESTPIYQEKNKAFSGVSASDLQEELQQYSQPQHEESVEGVSPVATASSMGRRRSSTSLMITTDPTSYAQSERSGSGTDCVQTPITPKNRDQMGQTQPISPDPAPPSETIPQTLSDAGRTPASDIAASPFDMNVPTSVSHPKLQIAAEPPTTHQAGLGASQVDCTQEIKITPHIGPAGHQDSQPAYPKHLEEHVSSGPTVDTRTNAGSGAASHDSSSSKRVMAGPMQDMSPNKKLNLAKGPVPKRGLPRDPKTLVAVPKILHSKTSNAPTGNTDPDASTSAHKSTSIATLDPTEAAEMTPDFSTEETSAQPTVANDLNAPQERAAEPHCFKQVEQSPDLPKGNNHQLATEALGTLTSNGTPEGKISASMSCSAVAQESGPPSTAHSKLQPRMAATDDEEAQPPADNATSQQPIIQQKKRKTKKSKKAKKPKPSQEGSANGSSPTHSRSSTKEEIKISDEIKAPMVFPKAETPYLADDNTPLPQPSFVRHNHSSMRSRNGPMFKGPQNTSDNNIVKAPVVNVAPASTARERQLFIYFLHEQPTESSDSQSYQDQQVMAAQIRDRPQVEDDRCTLSVDERQARLRVLDSHVQHNNLAPIKDLLQVLSEVAPREPGLGCFGEEDSASKAQSDGSSDTLDETTEPRLIEINSDDETQPALQPSAIPTSQSHPSGSDMVSSSLATGGENPPQSPGSFRAFPENVIPSTKEQPKTPSWKEIVTKSSTPTLQAGDIVEFIPKETEGDNKSSQTPGIVRKTKGKDPWRVPSAEQPWGKNSKSK
ncbi:MAG: hypothetical protein Q9168_004363 [Polycauliona sp. 1 TL-2023]